MSRKKFSRVQLKSVSREAVYTQEKLAQRVGISGKLSLLSKMTNLKAGIINKN
jgi:hypothetical protein